MQYLYGLITYSIFVILMLGYPIYTTYQLRLVSKGKILATIKFKNEWTIFYAFCSIVMGLVALFIVYTCIVQASKISEFGIWGWLLLFSALLFFGSSAVELSPWRAKLILTDKGIIIPSFAAGWHRIKNYAWVYNLSNKIYALRISVKYFGIKIPIPIYGFSPDSDAITIIDDIFKQKLSR